MPLPVPPLPPLRRVPRLEVPWSVVRSLAHARLFVARHRLAYWLAVGAVAVGAATSVQTRLTSVDAARRAWGDTRTVLVADRPLAAGEPLAGAASARDLPVAALPIDAVERLDEDAVALHAIGAGEVLAAQHVAPGTGLAAALPRGTAGVAVARTDAGPRLSIGDLVDVVLADDPLGATGGPAGRVLSAGTAVVDVTESAVVVAVPEADAPLAAAAAAGGRAVLVVRRTPEPPSG
jgi:hypothetical protein